MDPETNVTVRELAEIMKSWLRETINSEIEGWQERDAPRAELGTFLTPAGDQATRRIRVRRFREAMEGLEPLLMGERELDFQVVLERMLHNIGAVLHELGILGPTNGLLDGPQFDFRSNPSFPAMAAPVRYVALPLLTRAMRELGFERHWGSSSVLHLTELRVWQPRLLRGPAYDRAQYALGCWSTLNRAEITLMPMSPIPGGHHSAPNELLMIGQRTSLLGRLFDAAPRREVQIVRLSAREFTYMLRALLIDYERLHTARQREVADQDQLGAMLWEFLSKDE